MQQRLQSWRRQRKWAREAPEVPVAANGQAEASELAASRVVAPVEGAPVALVAMAGLLAAVTARPGNANSTRSPAEPRTVSGLSFWREAAAFAAMRIY